MSLQLNIPQIGAFISNTEIQIENLIKNNPSESLIGNKSQRLIWTKDDNENKSNINVSDEEEVQVFMTNLEVIKLQKNLEFIRRQLLPQKGNSKTKDQYKKTADRLHYISSKVRDISFSYNQYLLEFKKEEQRQLDENTRNTFSTLTPIAESSDLNSNPQGPQINNEERISQLRNRISNLSHQDKRNELFGGSEAKATGVTTDEKLNYHQKLHDEYTSSLVHMASNLRQNAMTFNEAMARDNDVLGATEKALDQSANKVTSIGSRLKIYNTGKNGVKIGWMFLIKAVAFMVISVLISLFFIWFLPKF